MPASTSSARFAAPLLYLGLVAILILFSVPAKYPAPVHLAIALAGILVVGGAALALGSPALRRGSDDTRRLALAGLLLVAPWAVFAVMAGFGPPWTADSAQNHLRYKGLLLDMVLVGGGMAMLGASLAGAGERVWSTLGTAAALIATPAYLAWGAVIMGSYLAHDHPAPGQIALGASPLGPASEILLFFGSVLTYVATACFARSARRLGWLTARCALAYQILAALAVLALLVRGMEYPDASASWYLTPGFIAGIPAIPWLMPYLLGVRCLRRAATEPASPSSLP